MRGSLIAARASGLKSARDQNGEMIVYQDDSAMKSALDMIDGELRRLSGPQSQTIIVRTSKGL